MPKLNNVKILDLIFERRVNLREVSKACNVSVGTLSAIVRGTRSAANVPTVARLADYFGVSPFELIVQKGGVN